ncbi:hypothetical protein GCM10009798_32500 [Nocardioides panacihumi]|uniref:PHP domain-containing protein n=1 Tax=Nocardioides panacihumi TaxID=400774 RepID=A0ABN2RIN2_9ACTN
MSARVAVHLHTGWSFDGHWPLERLVRILRRRGYDAMLTAEHSQSLSPEQWERYQEACAALTTPDFLVVPGLEYRDADNVVHVPVWGERMPHLGDRRETGELLADVAGHGGAAVLAHPARRAAWTLVRPEWVPLLSGVEVWNRKYDGLRPSDPGATLARERDLPALASLDFHRRRQLAPLATRIDVDGPLETSTVVTALRAGRVRPEFLGRPVATWTRGAPSVALRGAEEGRRMAAATVRRLRRAST